MDKYNKAENEEQREIYEEEQNKINEWNQNWTTKWRFKWYINYKYFGAYVDKTTKIVADTNKNTETQNERLKDLKNEIRKSDKICCEIILILILIGLIMVLYSKEKNIKEVS